MPSLIRTILLLVVFVLPCPLSAHPHAWISMKTAFVFNDKGQIVAMKEHWLFDKMYTAFALQDFDPNHNGKLDKDELMELARENLKGLKEFNYFTVVEMDGHKKLAFGELSAMDSYLEHDQIAIDFTLPFAEPFDANKQKLTYRIYDPTYYIDMGHYEKEPVHFEGPAPKNCNFEIAHPAVDINLIASAAALDKKATAPKDFGYSFAEKVTITCK